MSYFQRQEHETDSLVNSGSELKFTRTVQWSIVKAFFPSGEAASPKPPFHFNF